MVFILHGGNWIESRSTVVSDKVSGSLVSVPFDFDKPSMDTKLDDKLEEISGLALIDDSTLAAIEDERGYIYLLDASSGKIRSRHKFGSGRDYEGIELVGTSLYVLESDGDLYVVKNWNSDEISTVKIETRLTSRFDTEGLAYDASRNLLLIACKEYPGRRLSGFKSVYAWDLAVDTLRTRPVYAINYKAKHRDDFPGRLSDHIPDRDKTKRFKPSGISIDPKTGNVFILSSVWKSIVVLEPSGKILHVVDLPGEQFEQPEGLAFDSRGNLYVANEGNGKRGTLLKFDRLPATPTDN